MVEELRSMSAKNLSNKQLGDIVAGKGRSTPARRAAARHLLEMVTKGKLIDLGYEKLDGKTPSFDVSMTGAELGALSDEELDALAARLGR